MGQFITKLYTVSLGASTDPSKNIYGSIQEAIDAAEAGTTIVLSSGNHSGFNDGIIHIKPSLRFYGLQGAKITSPMSGDGCDVVFDNIIFENRSNESIRFSNGKGYLFRNCEFLINIKGEKCKNKKGEIRFGFHLSNASALLQNCIFCVNVENVDVFIVIGANDGASYLSLQSPVVRVQYKNVNKIETYFFRGFSDTIVVPYFEAFSSSIHYRVEQHCNRVYDGHCCVKEKNKHRCDKHHCRRKALDCHCKRIHSCCDRKCKHYSSKSTNIRLFRGLDCVNASLIGTKIYFIEGEGFFNIASGNAPIYVNSLTATATVGEDWEVGEFRKLLLTSFMSNLKCACDIKECNCVEDCSEEDKDECLPPCPQPCSVICPPPCSLPCTQLCPQPCPQPCPVICPQPCPFPCPPCNDTISGPLGPTIKQVISINCSRGRRKCDDSSEYSDDDSARQYD